MFLSKIDTMSTIVNDLPDINFIWRGFTEKMVGGLMGESGVGKSFFAMEVAISLASGSDGNLLKLGIKKTGKVVYLSAGEPKHIIERRLHAISEHLTEEQKQSVAENMSIFNVTGTLNMSDIIDQQEIFETCGGSKLIIMDNLPHIYIDDKNYCNVLKLISVLYDIANKTGSAILVLLPTSMYAKNLFNSFKYFASLEQVTRIIKDKTKKDTLIEGNYISFKAKNQYYNVPQAEMLFELQDYGVILPI